MQDSWPAVRWATRCQQSLAQPLASKRAPGRPRCPGGRRKALGAKSKSESDLYTIEKNMEYHGGTDVTCSVFCNVQPRSVNHSSVMRLEPTRICIGEVVTKYTVFQTASHQEPAQQSFMAVQKKQLAVFSVLADFRAGFGFAAETGQGKSREDVGVLLNMQTAALLKWMLHFREICKFLKDSECRLHTIPWHSK